MAKHQNSSHNLHRHPTTTPNTRLLFKHTGNRCPTLLADPLAVRRIDSPFPQHIPVTLNKQTMAIFMPAMATGRLN
ncbi:MULTISPECIES: hypothetical protein [unclassified Endozoicomonas]|uniref:hypothetical protein n=1 Tax=unclassified Endozoicomonas TaxID=2644528 RepID=UPI003BB4E585